MNTHGQALIETAAFSLAFSGMIICLLGFTQWFTARQKILVATREAALLYSSGRMSPNEVKVKTLHYLTTGSPALPSNGLEVRISSFNGLQAKLFSLDEITIRLTLESRWLQYLGLNPKMEETCIIKHAPHYGPPFQKEWGPPYPY